MSIRILGALIAGLFQTCAYAQSALVTFEEVPRHPSNFPVLIDTSGPLTFSSPICDPACRLDGIPVLDVSAMYGHIDLSASGPMGATVSDNMRFSTVSGQRFSLDSAYFGMTHPFGSPQIVAFAYRNGQAIASKSLFPQQDAAKIVFSWSDLDEVRFSVQFQTGYLTIDDIAVSVVPEPPATGLIAFGLAYLGLRARSRARLR